MVSRRSDGIDRPALLRSRRGKGTPYVADVVERVRVLIEGTALPEAVIAERVGIGVATVHGWKVRRGWRRPADVPLATRKVGVGRANFTRRRREALLRLEALATLALARTDGPPSDGATLARTKRLAEAVRRARRPARTREATVA